MARLTAALLALTASAALAGCTYGTFGLGVGDGYYDDYYGSYYGWYDDYYYPGTGYFIYDRGGNRHRWDEHHRRHWEGRRDGRDGHEHWAGYDRRDGAQDGRRDGRREGSEGRGGKDGQWGDRRDGEHRGDRNGWRGNAGSAAAETAVATPSVRQDPPRRDGWRDGRAGSGRGDGSAGYQRDNSSGRGAPVSQGRETPRQSPEAARESRPAPSEARRAPEVVRESRVTPVESPKPADVRPVNRESVRGDTSAE